MTTAETGQSDSGESGVPPDQGPDESSEVQDTEVSNGFESGASEDARTKFVGELRTFYGGNLEKVGLKVFAITALALITYIVLAGISFAFFPKAVDAYPAFRFAELLLKVAATGLIIALIGRAQNAFVLAFGIILIGALIVPSKDLVQIALIASGSDGEYESMSGSSSGGGDLAGRSTDVASKIILGLEEATLMTLNEAYQRKRALRIITDAIREEQEITLLEQVVSRGALSALQNVDENLQEWVYKYGQNEDFISDLRFLRSERLITYAYNDISSVEVTTLGHAVLQRKFHDPIVLLEDPLVSAGNSSSCDLDLRQIPQVPAQALTSLGYDLNIEVTTQEFQFTPSDAARYRITLDADDTADPVLYLTDMQAGNVSYCTLVAYNDDSNTTLNSTIEVYLNPQPYVIELHSFDDRTGLATLKIEQITGE